MGSSSSRVKSDEGRTGDSAAKERHPATEDQPDIHLHNNKNKKKLEKASRKALRAADKADKRAQKTLNKATKWEAKKAAKAEKKTAKNQKKANKRVTKARKKAERAHERAVSATAAAAEHAMSPSQSDMPNTLILVTPLPPPDVPDTNLTGNKALPANPSTQLDLPPGSNPSSPDPIVTPDRSSLSGSPAYTPDSPPPLPPRQVERDLKSGRYCTPPETPPYTPPAKDHHDYGPPKDEYADVYMGMQHLNLGKTHHTYISPGKS